MVNFINLIIYYTMGKRKEELLFFSFVALARARAI